MYRNELIKLCERQFISIEELDIILKSRHISNFEDCGESGNYIGYNWYIVTTSATKNEDMKDYYLFYKPLNR